MKHILFIDVIPTDYSYPRRLSVNNGISSLAYIAKQQGYEISVIKALFIDSILFNNLLYFIKQHDFEYIGLSIPFYPNYDMFPYLLQIKQLTNAKVLIGGLSTYSYYSDYEKHSECWDYVFLGESETPFYMFLTNADKSSIPNFVYKDNDKIINNGLTYIDDLRNKKYELGVMDKFIKPFMKDLPLEVSFTRGCIYQCNFCVNSGLIKTLKEHNVIKTPSEYFRKDTFEEIFRYLKYYKDLGFKRFEFMDDLMFNNIVWFEEFIQKYIEILNEHEIYSIYTIIPFINQQFLDILYKYDFKIHNLKFGIEHGSEQFRKEVLNRPYYTNEQVYKVKELLQSTDRINNIKATIMYGFPEEDEQLFNDSLQILADIGELGAVSPVMYVPIKNTVLFDKYKDNYGIPNEYVSTFNQIYNINYSKNDVRRWRMGLPFYLNMKLGKEHTKILTPYLTYLLINHKEINYEKYIEKAFNKLREKKLAYYYPDKKAYCIYYYLTYEKNYQIPDVPDRSIKYDYTNIVNDVLHNQQFV